MKTILMFLLTLVPFSAFSQVPRYNVTMTPADYQLLYSRDIFSDSLLPATLAVNRNGTAISGQRRRSAFST